MTRQTIFITGAASGIGKATALQFHRRGWFVGATDIGESGLAALAEELNGMHAALPLLKKTPNSLCFTTSSSAARFGAPGMAAYGATKVAVKGLTEAISCIGMCSRSWLSATGLKR